MRSERVFTFEPGGDGPDGPADLAELSRWLEAQVPDDDDVILLRARGPQAGSGRSAAHVTDDALVAALQTRPVAVAAVPTRAVTETLKRVDGAGRVTGTVDRQAYRQVELPQAFRAGPLCRAIAVALTAVTVPSIHAADLASLLRLVRAEGDLVEIPLEQPVD